MPLTERTCPKISSSKVHQVERHNPEGTRGRDQTYAFWGVVEPWHSLFYVYKTPHIIIIHPQFAYKIYIDFAALNSPIDRSRALVGLNKYTVLATSPHYTSQAGIAWKYKPLSYSHTIFVSKKLEENHTDRIVSEFLNFSAFFRGFSPIFQTEDVATPLQDLSTRTLTRNARHCSQVDNFLMTALSTTTTGHNNSRWTEHGHELAATKTHSE